MPIRCRTQAAIVATERKGWRFDWRLPEVDDSTYFVEHPAARFLARSWRMNDNPRRPGGKSLEDSYVDLLDREIVVLSFRSGCRAVLHYYPLNRTAWRLAQDDARHILSETPELGVDGDNPLPGLQS